MSIGPSARGLFAPLQRISEIAMAGALHDCLRYGELGAKTFRLKETHITAAGQQESQFRRADLLVELGVAAFGDVQVEGFRRFPEHLVLQGIAGREHLEGRSNLLSEVARCPGLPPLLAILAIQVS